MNEKISVIVPVYNVERFLEKCVDSILNQTYTNLEVILVDDGSKDSSLEICRKLQARDSRIRIVEKKNEGAGAARNAGLAIAEGELIMFIDSDDWIEPGMFAHLHDLMTKSGADLAVCNYFIELPNGSDRVVYPIQLPTTPYETGKIPELIQILDSQGKLAYLWNRIYRHSIIRENGVAFDNFFTTGQDLDFNLKYLRHVRKCVMSEEPYYHYIKHGTGSLCARYKKNLYGIVSELSKRRMETYEQFGMLAQDDTRRLYEKTHVEYLATCVPNMFRQNADLTRSQRRQMLAELFRDEKLRSYIGTYQPSNGNQKIFRQFAKLGSPDAALAAYSVLFWIRNDHSGLYQKLKR